MNWEMLPFSIDSSTMRRMHNENWQVHGFHQIRLRELLVRKGSGTYLLAVVSYIVVICCPTGCVIYFTLFHLPHPQNMPEVGN